MGIIADLQELVLETRQLINELQSRLDAQEGRADSSEGLEPGFVLPVEDPLAGDPVLEAGYLTIEQVGDN